MKGEPIADKARAYRSLAVQGAATLFDDVRVVDLGP